VKRSSLETSSGGDSKIVREKLRSEYHANIPKIKGSQGRGERNRRGVKEKVADKGEKGIGTAKEISQRPSYTKTFVGGTQKNPKKKGEQTVKR